MTSTQRAKESQFLKVDQKLILYVLFVCLVILIPLYYWFAEADRNLVFLYNHEMGPRVPDTSPFSFVTASRYWMAGLVANGYVLILLFPFHFILYRLKRNYTQPAWWKIFLVCAPVLIAGVFIITMKMGQPVLPFRFAIRVVISTLAGLAIVLKALEFVREKLTRLILYATDGFILAFFMVTSAGWISNFEFLSSTTVKLLFVLNTLCLVGLFLTSLIYIRKKIAHSAFSLFILSLVIAYPFGAVFHHILGTDGHYYISNSDNFFTGSIATQFIVWAVCFLLLYGIVKLRKHFY